MSYVEQVNISNEHFPFTTIILLINTCTHTTVYRPLVRDYPGRPVPEETLTHSHPSWLSDIFINCLHLLRSIASSLFSLRAWQSFLTTSLQVSLVFLLVLGPLLHAPCISSDNGRWLSFTDQNLLNRWVLRWRFKVPSSMEWKCGVSADNSPTSGAAVWLNIACGVVMRCRLTRRKINNKWT